MSKIDDYRCGQEFCAGNATNACSRGLKEIWQTLAENYAFMVELESQPGSALASARPEPKIYRAVTCRSATGRTRP